MPSLSKIFANLSPKRTKHGSAPHRCAPPIIRPLHLPTRRARLPERRSRGGPVVQRAARRAHPRRRLRSASLGSASRRKAFATLAFLAGTSSTVLSPPDAQAQNPYPCPSHITIRPVVSPQYRSSVTVEVDWGEDGSYQYPGGLNCLAEGLPPSDPSTFAFTVNGVDQTAAFTTSAGYAVGTITGLTDLQQNYLSASVAGWQTSGRANMNYSNVQVFADLTPVPSMDPEPHNGDNQDLSLCASDCFAATYAHSTVPYITLDQPRSITLLYRGDRVAPRPFIHVDARVPAGAYAPSEYWLEAETKTGTTWSDVNFLNGDVRKIRFAGDTGRVRLSGQLDAVAAGLGTGVHPLRITVSAKYSNGAVETAAPITTTLIVVDQASSPIARGWTIAGIQRVHFQGDTGILVVDGDGSAGWYTKLCSPGCIFASPRGDFSKLTVSGSGTSAVYTRAYPDSSKVTFNHLGLMVRAEDRFGAGSNLIYDGTGRLTDVTDPYATQGSAPAIAAAIRLIYDANGLSEIREPLIGGAAQSIARTTWVRVESDRRLRAIKDPDGDSTRFGYDGSSRLATIVNRRGDTTTYGYDTAWLLSSVTLPAVQVDAGGGNTTLANPPPAVTFTGWQRSALPTSSTSSTPATRTRTDSALARLTDELGRQTTYTVDRWGQPVRSVGSTGLVTTVFRSSGTKVMPDSIRDHLGQTEKYTWYGPHLASHTSPGQPTKYFLYSAHSVVTEVTTYNSSVPDSHWFIGPRGRVDSTRLGDLAGTMSRFTYDSLYRLVTAADPMGHTTRYHYDGTFGNTDSIVAPGNRYTHRRFDRFGRDSVLEQGGQPERRAVYDVMNRVVETYDGVNTQPTRYGYDALFVTRVQDPKLQVFRFQRNALGDVTQEYDPADTLNRYLSYRYDRFGRVTSTTNRRGERVDVRFDSLGRMLSKTGTNAAADSFAYSADGRIAVGWNGVSRDSVFTSASGWTDSVVTRIGGQRFRIRYKPDALQRLDSVTIASSTSIAFAPRTYTYNTSTATLDTMRVAGRLTYVRRNSELEPYQLHWLDASMLRHSLTTAIHRPSRHQLLAGVIDFELKAERRYGYDSTSRITEVSDWHSGSSYGGRQYSFDGLGRLSGYADQAHTTCAPVDSLFGFNCVPDTATPTVTYSYDAAGNRTEATDTLFATGNRVIRFNGDSMAYDLDGNRVRKVNAGTGRDARFYWTADGRLDSVHVGSVGITYDYNATGQLVRRSRNGVVERYYLWDGAHLLAELDGSATARVTEYVYQPGVDQPLALVTGETAVDRIRYYALDALGNVMALVDTNALDQSITYDPWGVPAFTGSTENRLAWKGLLWEGDSTQLYYMRNRWYDPDLGRFLTEDPVGLAGGLNIYLFARNDPVNGRDPLGLFPCPFIHNPQWCPTQLPPVFAGPSGPHSWDYGGTGGTGGGGGGGGSAQPHWRAVLSVGFDEPGSLAPHLADVPYGPVKPLQSRECSVEQLMFLFTVAGDVAFFSGVGAAGKWAVVGIRHGRAAAQIAKTARLARTNRYANAVAARNGAYWLAATDLSVVGAGSVSLDGIQMTVAQAPDISLGDFIPIKASFNAWDKMAAACGY